MDKRVKKRQGNKQILKHLDNPKLFRMMIQRGDFVSRFSGTEKTVARLEELGYTVTREADL